MTSAKPSVMTMNAVPNRVRAIGDEVAVEQPAERQLQRVLGAQDERGDADVERREHTDAREREEALLRAAATAAQTSSRKPRPPTSSASERK